MTGLATALLRILQGKRRFILAVTISIPQGGQNAKVRVNGGVQTICAEGTASMPGNVYPNKVWAMLYQTEPIPSLMGPPPGATQGTITSNDQWSFTGGQEIPGASSSGSSPYPKNWIVIWAEYDGMMTSYDTAVAVFYGLASTGTDCS
jgi:hypothetical protein